MTTWLGRFLAAICLVGLAQAGYESYTARTHTRACHAQLKKLQQDLDSLGSANVDAPMDEIYGRLVAAGLLAGQMGRSSSGTPAVLSLEIEDPGGGPGSFRNYAVMAGTRTIGCCVHGSPTFNGN